MQKTEYITELYRKTLEHITVNAEAWRAFLRSAAYQYKYPFSDQILIYAQKPSATACASLELWNKRLWRWINRSATGIALLREKNGRCSLYHVFDVSDTHHRENEPFAVWSIRPEYEADVIEVLQNRFIDDGKTRDKVSDAVLAAAENLGTDNITDYLQELSYGKEGSFLEELDDDNIRVRLLITVQASAAYAVLTRLGYDADRLVDKDSFAWVHEFNTPAVVNILGNAASGISGICLREIERTVKSIERSIQKENRIFDSQAEKGYTEGETKEQGGKTYGAELQNGKRHEIPESGAARSDELSNREVRSDEAELSEGASQGNLHDSADRGRAEPASPRDRRDGESADIAEYIPDGTEPWGVGADESREPDAVGGDDEQYQGGSGGGSSDEYDLRLSLEELPAPDEKVVISVLRHGERLRESKADVVSFLCSESDENKKTEYVKSIYPTEVREEFILPENKEHIGYYARTDEFVIYQGEYAARTHEAVFSWDLTRRLIEALIKDKNYLDEPKTDKQMSLFDVPEVQDQVPLSTELVKELNEPKVQQNFVASQEVIDEFLRLGGCIMNSAQRIYGFYRRANDQAENVAFLKREYETDSVGIIINDHKYAVKWDNKGVMFSSGDKVSDTASTLLSWEAIDKRIWELLWAGQYLSQNEAEKAIDIWDNFVATRISFMYRDIFENIPKEYKTESEFVWPKVNEFYKGILLNAEKIETFIKEVEANIERLVEYPPRLRLYLQPQVILDYLKSYCREPIDFPKADPDILPPKQFVTQDKIDSFLIRKGSNVSGNKLRIYSFFLRHKNLSERAKFLSGDYGQGGSSGLRIDNSHDSKGLFLCGGLQDKTTGIFLKWSQVSKRVDELIRQDKYLTEQEKSELDNYEKKQIAGSIRGFYQYKSDAVKPYSSEYGMFDADKIDFELFLQLDNKERVNEILADMQGIFDSETPGSRHYDYDKQVIADVRAYAEGRYNLFPGSKFRRKEPVRKEAKETVPPAEKEEQTADVDFTRYGLRISLGTWLYIGKEEMQLTSTTEDGVELYNGTLFPMEMPLNVFIRMVKENPLNEHLKVQEQIGGKLDEKPVAVDTDEVEPAAEELFPDLEYRLSVGTEVYLLQSKYKIQRVCDNVVEVQNDLMMPVNMELEYFLSKLRSNPLNDHLRKESIEQMDEMSEPSESHQREAHIYVDTDGEKLIWLYYNPDAESGGQFVTSSLAFKMFKEAYDDFSENGGDWSNKAARENFINRIGEMADQRLADVNTPFFTEAEAFYEEEPDYIGFTSENIQQIGQNIENHIVDLEAERELNAHEAEFGADGYRAFPGNRPEQENPESLSIWQRYEKAKQLYPEAVAAIRVGDFYEFFGEDAERVSKLLDLMLTSRQTDGADRVPMCGIPFHVTDKYFSKLLDAGIRIAVDDDDLTPKIILPNTRKQAERFVVVKSEDIAGDPYEVWDKEKNAIHIDENGNRSTFISRWQADNFASELNRWEYEKTRDHSGELFYEDTEPDENTASESDAASQKYDLGFGFLGNGLSVWNRLQNEHGDYKTIAHIATDRTVRFYDRNIPESVKKRIYEVAATSDGRISETQDIPIFSTSKLDRIPLQEDEPGIRETISQLTVQPKPQKTNRVYAFHPEIPDSEKRNYRITDDEIGMGGAKEKFRKNIAAIKLLYQLEAENRLASPDEQEILAQYSGWGGLAEAFDDTKDNWYQEYNELKALLPTEEYEAAKESTLTAFYTPPVVIKAIYQAIENMGFVRGNVLEPSCGIGNFMGLVPEHMDAKMYGVELDSLSGRIARQLYQKNSITIDGYEKTQFPDSFFDVAVGNVPFNAFKLFDKKYDKYNFLIHDYFFGATRS